MLLPGDVGAHMSMHEEAEVVVRGVRPTRDDFRPVPLGYGPDGIWRRIALVIPWAGSAAILARLGPHVDFDTLMSGFGILTAALVVAALVASWSRHAHMAMSAAAAQAQAPFDVVVDLRGITWRPPGGQLVWPWRQLAVCAEDDARFLYGTSPLSVGIIPKRCMSADQIARLRELFARHRAGQA